MAGLYCVDNARQPGQADEMRRLEAAGECVLCDADLLTVTTGHWSIRLNAWPYKDTRQHLLLSTLRHVTDISALSTLERADFWRALGMACRAYGIDDYELRWRSGDPSRTGGTIAHTHAHLIVR